MHESKSARTGSDQSIDCSLETILANANGHLLTGALQHGLSLPPLITTGLCTTYYLDDEM
jgi:hypothetical protein